MSPAKTIESHGRATYSNRSIDLPLRGVQYQPQQFIRLDGLG